MKCDEDAVASPHTNAPAEQHRRYGSGKPEAAAPGAVHSRAGLRGILSECGEAAGGIPS